MLVVVIHIYVLRVRMQLACSCPSRSKRRATSGRHRGVVVAVRKFFVTKGFGSIAVGRAIPSYFSK